MITIINIDNIMEIVENESVNLLVITPENNIETIKLTFDLLIGQKLVKI